MVLCDFVKRKLIKIQINKKIRGGKKKILRSHESLELKIMVRTAHFGSGKNMFIIFGTLIN